MRTMIQFMSAVTLIYFCVTQLFKEFTEKKTFFKTFVKKKFTGNAKNMAKAYFVILTVLLLQALIGFYMFVTLPYPK